MERVFIRQRDYLLEISRALTSQLSLTEVLRIILRSATNILAGQAGLIALASDSGFEIRASYGIEREALKHLHAFINKLPTRHKLDPAIGQQMRIVAQTARLGDYEVIALPMTVGEEQVGVVFIFRQRGRVFARNDVAVLQSFADQAAIAVHNARLYEQMTTEKKRLNALLLHSADGIMILKADQTVESINLSLARMLGIENQMAENHTILYHDELINWSHREPGPDLGESMLGGWPMSEDNVLYVEGDLIPPGETDGHVSVGITYAPLFDDNNHLRNIIASIHNITRFREAEQAKSTFISMMSHELKTPVSIIRGYAETLRRDDVEWDRETVSGSLDVILEEIGKLTDMIENLLDVSRVQAGMLKLQVSPVHLEELSARLVEKFSKQTSAHTLEVDFPEDFPTVHVDEQRIRQVITNLLSNAIKYSPDGGEISITGSVFENMAILNIRDHGIGITPEQQEYVFDPFYRVDNGLTRETQGVGLGLYIVKSIVEAHRGTIRVSSSEGGGTQFTISLPLGYSSMSGD